MQHDAGVLEQPVLHGWGLVGGVVVEHEVQVEVFRGGLVDFFEEPEELGRAVAWVVPGDRPGEDVHGREHDRGAMADVVVGRPRRRARHHRQDRRRPVQRLHLGLLVHRQDQSVLRRRYVQPDDIADLVHELWILGQLPRVDRVRLQTEGPPDPRHLSLIQPWPAAIDRVDQCVSPFGGSSCNVLVINALICSSVSLRGCPGRGESSRPSKRSVRNRSRHFVTVGALTPSRRATPATDGSSAYASRIDARCTSLVGDVGRRTHPERTDRSCSVRTRDSR